MKRKKTQTPGELLRQLRGERTLEDVAPGIGHNISAISRHEHGLAISIGAAYRYSKFYGRPMEDFLPLPAIRSTRSANE